MLVFVIENDKRDREVSQLFLKKGHYVSNDIKDIQYADYIYLGLKGIDSQNRIIHQKQNCVIEEKIFKKLSKKQYVFTIAYNHYLEELSKINHFQYFYMMNDEDFIHKNTIMTIEGLLSYMIDKSVKPLMCSSICITGFGYCGKMLAHCLKSLDSEVCVIVRNKKQREEIESLGCTYQHLSQMNLNGFDMIINTIPNPIINKEKLKEIDEETILIDIASFPYGIDHHSALQMGYESFIVSAIPAHYFSQYSGQCIVDTMIKKGDRLC